MNYFEVYKDVWNYHKRNSKMLDTDEYWQKVTNESIQIERKYKGEKFVVDLLLAVLFELERGSKENKKD